MTLAPIEIAKLRRHALSYMRLWTEHRIAGPLPDENTPNGSLTDWQREFDAQCPWVSYHMFVNGRQTNVSSYTWEDVRRGMMKIIAETEELA